MTDSTSWRFGPNHNHKPGQKYQWSYSGSGYNRVRLCSCGAEDHAPSFISTIDNAELESLRRDAERWRAIAPYLTAGKIGWLLHLFHLDGDMTAEQFVDRLVEEARKKT